MIATTTWETDVEKPKPKSILTEKELKCSEDGYGYAVSHDCNDENEKSAKIEVYLLCLNIASFFYLTKSRCIGGRPRGQRRWKAGMSLDWEVAQLESNKICRTYVFLRLRRLEEIGSQLSRLAAFQQPVEPSSCASISYTSTFFISGSSLRTSTNPSATPITAPSSPTPPHSPSPPAPSPPPSRPPSANAPSPSQSSVSPPPTHVSDYL